VLTDTDLLRVLVTARATLSDPAHWTQDTWARDQDGQSVTVQSSTAVRFCAAGAMLKALLDVGTPYYLEHVLNCVAACADQDDHNMCGVTAVNDVGGYAAVLALIDRAIAKLSVAGFVEV
jgi:alpha-D-ribose 1-methylphosphonate 5-triphosphate synthase subunit PhnH